MKTSKLIVCCLGLALITDSSLVCVHGKRQQPSHDEIERIVNDTHSIIWKCPECHPGSGFIVQCGSSISIDIPIKCVPCVKGVNYSNTQDHSTCKSCRNCAKHENKRGECTPDEDTTECLGTCHEGFYMDKITGECHPCSDCCNNVTTKRHHEEQCEDSGLPRNQQCRQSNLKCPSHSTMPSPLPDNHDDEPGSQGTSTLTIALIIIGVFFLLLIVLLLVLLRCYGWERVKSFLTRCCCCQLVLPTEGNTVNFHASDQFIECDLEAAHGTVSGSHLTENGDVLTNLSSLPAGAKTVRRPTFQRLHSVPVETKSKSEIPRSFSHPGALNWDLSKFDKLKESFKRPGGKKHTKKGYTLVETEPPMIDRLSAERVDKRSFPIPTTSGRFVKFSVGADDFEAQEPGNKTPAPPEQHEIDMPVQNHGKNGDIKPALSGSVPGNGPQSAGSRIGDPGLGKSSLTDQCTSTKLHLSSKIKFANIPQDFLDMCLAKRVLTIPTKFRRTICMMIDIPRELLWDDYRLLAEKIGLGPNLILWLGQQRNKTELILQQFDAQEDPSVRRFKEILEEMGRNDVVIVIEDWLLFEWNKQTASSSLL